MEFKSLTPRVKIPVLGLGTWRMGGEIRADYSRDKEYIEAIRYAIKRGIIHIDTAEAYGAGHAEELVGEVIKGCNRKKLFITTKVSPHHLSFKNILAACERSLKRLQTDYIDLYLIHWPNPIASMKNAMAAFDQLRADAVTVNPYLGRDALLPLLERKDKGIIAVVRTTNPGSDEFQCAPVLIPEGPERDLLWVRVPEIFDEIYGTVPLWACIAASIVLKWNENGNCGIGFGATYPKDLAIARKIVGDMPMLLPGIGAQQAEVKTTVEAAKDSRGWGMIINASRSIIFASKGEDFAEAAKRETIRLRDEINRYRWM